MKRWIATAALLAGALPLASAHAKTQAFRDWALRCPEDSACILEQRVFLEGSGETMLLHVAFQRPSGSSGIIAMVLAPLRLELAKGLRLRIDQGAEQSFTFHHCRAEGCLALVPVTAELRRTLERGRQARVTFTTIEGQSLGIPLSLLGITKGLRALAKSSSSMPSPVPGEGQGEGSIRSGE